MENLDAFDDNMPIPPRPPPFRRQLAGLANVPVYIIDSNNNINRISRVLRTGDDIYCRMIPEDGRASPIYYLFYDPNSNIARWYQIGNPAIILEPPNNITNINPNLLVLTDHNGYTDVINSADLIDPNIRKKYFKYKKKYFDLLKTQ